MSKGKNFEKKKYKVENSRYSRDEISRAEGGARTRDLEVIFIKSHTLYYIGVSNHLYTIEVLEVLGLFVPD